MEQDRGQDTAPSAADNQGEDKGIKQVCDIDQSGVWIQQRDLMPVVNALCKLSIIKPMLSTYLISAATIGFSAGVTPGPLQAVFLAYAVKGGWKQALPAAFAPLVTDGPVILLVLLVLKNLPPAFLRALQIGGAAFLLYLAWDAFNAYRHFQTIQAVEATSG